MSTPVGPGPAAAKTPVTLFYSYAHEDEALRDELQDHLMILERRGVIRSWHDRALVPGQDWDERLREQLRTADLVLLLISKDFIRSDFIMDTELRLAMDRQREGHTVVVPVLLRPVDLQPEDEADLPFAGLLKLQGLPKDLTPVTSWPNRDEAWTNVARGVRATVTQILARRPVHPPVAPGPPAFDVRDADAAEPVTSTPDPVLTRVLNTVTTQIVKANAAKGGAALDEPAVRRQVQRLIDVQKATRVLWVDDHPANNRAEIAVFAKLQIDVVTAQSSDAGLEQLAAAEGDAAFDLVVSDWNRDAEGPLAGLRLLGAMHARGHAQPVVFYHGTFASVPRAALALAARTAGAFGEAVLPDELLRLVLAAVHA